MNEVMKAKRIVIKIGTSTLTHKSGNINIRRVEKLVKVISDLKNSGKEIILVSSGAIGVGCGKLGLAKRPEDMPSKQALAAIGQCELMYLYDEMFSKYNHIVAQILLTGDIISEEDRIYNAKNTFEKLLGYNVIPIVNENDTISTEEIEFGDNDTLSAIVGNLVGADLLILLTDIDGLYDKNPNEYNNAKKIDVVSKIDDYIISIASGKGSEFGTGGMLTKVKAGKIAMEGKMSMVIMSSDYPEDLYALFEGENKGTLFKGK